MDCNKEDAFKARQVAESKLTSEDYVGAKRFILKSQRLFPSLSGLPQMLAVVNVHISAHEAGDELDFNWHHILQVEQGADEETVRKQYRKLLLLLHPDKNKYAGAESAFKLVQSAHQVFETEKELAKASANASLNQRFWTVCLACKTPSEHSESLEDHYVQCPECLRSFLAVRLSQSMEEIYQSKGTEKNADGLQKEAEQEPHNNDDDDDVNGEGTGKGTEMKVDLSSSSLSSSEDFGKRKRRKCKVQSKMKIEMSSSASSSSSEDIEKIMKRKFNVESKKKAKASSLTSPNVFQKKMRRQSKERLSKTSMLEQRHSQAASKRGTSGKRRRASSVVDVKTDLSSDSSFDECYRDSISCSMREDGFMHRVDIDIGESSQGVMKGNGCMKDAEAHMGDCSFQKRYADAMDDTEREHDVSHHQMDGNAEGQHQMDGNAEGVKEKDSDSKIRVGDCSGHQKRDGNAEDGLEKNQDVEDHNGYSSHHQKHENAKGNMAKDWDVKVVFFEKLKSAIMSQLNDGEFRVLEVRQDNFSESAQNGEEGAGPSDKALQMNVAVSFTHVANSAHVRAAASEDCMAGGSEIWEEDQESVQCIVPDNDVYDFDKGREEECFEAGQIWAVYDDDDGLPRFYAHVAQVISSHPFHVRMNWLYPAKTVSDDVKAWTKAGLAYTCGEFILGKTITRKKVLIFSHIMAHETGEVARIICIYPHKGDIWALYKEWKPRKGRTRKCEPVQVISHYSKEQGVEVVALFKVNGYKSIYCRRGFEGLRSIPSSELSRFSHQIPAHYLEGNEFSDLPEDCVDLDMAAVI